MNDKIWMGAYTIAMAWNHLLTMLVFFFRGNYKVALGMLIMVNITGLLMYWLIKNNRK